MSDDLEFDRQRFQQFQMLNEKTVDTANITIKSGLLINGGAAVSVLGLLAGLLKEPSTQVIFLEKIATALMFFVWGVASAVFALALTYTTHYMTLEVINAEAEERRSERLIRIVRNAFHAISIIIALSPIVLFVLGAGEVKEALLSNYTSN